MAVYSAIANSEIAVNAPITNTLMTKLRENPLAVQEGDATASGQRIQTGAYADLSVTSAKMAADTIDQAKIAANAVGQSELKTTTASQTVSVAATTYNEIAPTGGINTLSWFAGGEETTPISTDMMTVACNNENAQAAIVGVFNYKSSVSTFYLYSNYLQASPPYDIGDGSVSSFIYALVDNSNGDILGVSAALDPPWAYHGQTNIAASTVDISGRSWRKERKWRADFLNGEGQNPYALLKSGDFVNAMNVLENNELVDFEITNTIKNRDMPYYPHPFKNQDLTGKTVVMLDPMSSFCGRMADLISDNFQEIPKLLHNKDILFSTSPLNRMMPGEVIAVAPRWR